LNERCEDSLDDLGATAPRSAHSATGSSTSCTISSLESSWFISTESSGASDVRDEVKDHIDADDELLVTKMPDSGGGRWETTFSGDTVDWVKDNL